MPILAEILTSASPAVARKLFPELEGHLIISRVFVIARVVISASASRAEVGIVPVGTPRDPGVTSRGSFALRSAHRSSARSAASVVRVARVARVARV